MARERMVTRTLTISEVSALVVDITTAQTATKVYTITGEIDGAIALKQLKKLYETETEKIVATTDIKTTEKLYGLPEVDFFKVAVELDPETRKRIE